MASSRALGSLAAAAELPQHASAPGQAPAQRGEAEECAGAGERSSADPARGAAPAPERDARGDRRDQLEHREMDSVVARIPVRDGAAEAPLRERPEMSVRVV